MEDELIAQRDAAIAVTKELQRQLQMHRIEMEKTFERRTLNAERLRLHAEEKLRRAVEDRDWSENCCRQLLALALFLGCGGAAVGWALGLLVLLVSGEPLVGFLLVLPGMAVGTLLGLAVAKAKIHVESRRRNSRYRDARRHFEVERAINSGVGEQDDALEPLQSVPGMADVADENSRYAEQDRRRNGAEEMPVARGTASLLGRSWKAAWVMLYASKDIAAGLYHGGDYVRGIFEHKHEKKP